MKFDIVFVVLVYRNIRDLRDFFNSNEIPDSKTIVVNSFYDDESECEFKEIAESNQADFLSVPNKGYGAGNNRGIDYALSNYDFNYLIVSNADITISRFRKDLIDKFPNAVLAPKILTLNNKNQNPSSPYKPIEWIDKLRYKVYKSNNSKLIIPFYAQSRLTKIFYYIFGKNKRRVFSPHGAFIIIPYNVLIDIVPIYNENMFLFFEEDHLGRLLATRNIPTFYIPEIVIRHKEDGSIAYLSDTNFSLMRNSYIKMYEYWHQ